MLPSRQVVDKRIPERMRFVFGESTTGLGKPHGLGVFPCGCHRKTRNTSKAKRLCCPTRKHRKLGCFSTNMFPHYLQGINVNESTFGRLPRALALDTIVVSSPRHVRCPSPGETGLVHNCCLLVFRRAREECGAAFLGLRCVHVQLHGCTLIGPSLATQTIGGKTVLG